MVMFEILNIISHLVGSIGSFGKKPYKIFIVQQTTTCTKRARNALDFLKRGSHKFSAVKENHRLLIRFP